MGDSNVVRGGYRKFFGGFPGPNGGVERFQRISGAPPYPGVFFCLLRIRLSEGNEVEDAEG